MTVVSSQFWMNTLVMLVGVNPIGSMYSLYFIYPHVPLKKTLNVGNYPSPMDPNLC